MFVYYICIRPCLSVCPCSRSTWLLDVNKLHFFLVVNKFAILSSSVMKLPLRCCPLVGELGSICNMGLSTFEYLRDSSKMSDVISSVSTVDLEPIISRAIASCGLSSSLLTRVAAGWTRLTPAPPRLEANMASSRWWWRWWWRPRRPPSPSSSSSLSPWPQPYGINSGKNKHKKWVFFDTIHVYYPTQQFCYIVKNPTRAIWKSILWEDLWW